MAASSYSSVGKCEPQHFKHTSSAALASELHSGVILVAADQLAVSWS